MIYSTSV